MPSIFDTIFAEAFETHLEVHGRDIEYVTPTGSRISGIKAIKRTMLPANLADLPGFTGELGSKGSYWEILKKDIDPDGICEKEDQIFDVETEECWLVARLMDETEVSWRIYATPI